MGEMGAGRELARVAQRPAASGQAARAAAITAFTVFVLVTAPMLLAAMPDRRQPG
jgi:hypothetical protein